MLTNNYLRGGAVQWMEDRCPKYVEKPIPVLVLNLIFLNISIIP